MNDSKTLRHYRFFPIKVHKKSTPLATCRDCRSAVAHGQLADHAMYHFKNGMNHDISLRGHTPSFERNYWEIEIVTNSQGHPEAITRRKPTEGRTGMF